MAIEVNETPNGLGMDKPESVDDRVWAWLSEQPLSALAAYLTGTMWEWKPESCEYMDSNIYWCDNCRTYHRDWVGYGLLVEDGVLALTSQTVDSDGDWSVNDSMDVLSPGFPIWFDQEFGDEWRRTQAKQRKEYLTWVFVHGKDPLGELHVMRRTIKRSWWLQLRWTPQFGLQCVGGECVGHTPGMVEFAKLPAEVRKFVTDSENDFPTWHSFYVDVMKLPEFGAHHCPVMVYHTQDITEFAETEDEYVRRLKAQAAMSGASIVVP